jgi:hypothetical protein
MTTETTQRLHATESWKLCLGELFAQRGYAFIQLIILVELGCVPQGPTVICADLDCRPGACILALVDARKSVN